MRLFRRRAAASDIHFDFGADKPLPSVFMQWKNTDVCMDLACDCGALNHYDGYFAYIVACSDCGQEWEMPPYIYPRKNQRHDGMSVLWPEPRPEGLPEELE